MMLLVNSVLLVLELSSEMLSLDSDKDVDINLSLFDTNNSC